MSIPRRGKRRRAIASYCTLRETAHVTVTDHFRHQTVLWLDVRRGVWVGKSRDDGPPETKHHILMGWRGRTLLIWHSGGPRLQAVIGQDAAVEVWGWARHVRQELREKCWCLNGCVLHQVQVSAADIGKTAELVDDGGRSDETGYTSQVQETQYTGNLQGR